MNSSGIQISQKNPDIRTVHPVFLTISLVRRQIDSTFRTFISSLSIGLFFFMARLNGT